MTIDIMQPAIQSLELEGLLSFFGQFSVSHYLPLFFSSQVYIIQSLSIGNPNAAAHVAVDLQCWSLQSNNTMQHNTDIIKF